MTGVMISARVVNIGSPSSTWNWRLTAHLVSGITVVSERLRPPPATFESEVKHSQFTLDAAQFLPWQLMDTPLATGASKTGWVLFLFDESLYTELGRPGVKMVLEFEDNTHKLVTAEETASAESWKY
jgi:hypothetical protein